ncbi:PQQ-dependent sugar dehydrogenase, partial [Flavihumibacter sediminis]|nr:PQQ-dependent sugar dehydrogenase [Flavihumibacter sediminis]
TSLNGKILRLNRDGSIPADNPIPGSPVWAWGFRNMQGLAENSRGQWYSSEHGEATDDELNLLQPLRNYGWPLIEGYLDTEKEKVHQLINQQEPLL